MNFFSAFTSEVFRPLVSILIPGAIGVSTWVIAILWQFEALKSLAEKNHTETAWVLLIAMIFAGVFFEDLGSHVESVLDERADRRSKGEHFATWFAYLRTAFVADPIGRRYIRSLVLRLKFELGVAFAMISAGLGLLWLRVQGLPRSTAICGCSLAVGFTLWAMWEAVNTHCALATTRSELLKDIRVIDRNYKPSEIGE